MNSLHFSAPIGPLKATVAVPGSKSVANRALVCALLADGESVITGVPDGDDTQVLLDVANEMGRVFRVNETTVAIRGSSSVRLPGIIDAQLAGTSSRFLTALAALCDTTCIIDGDAPLRGRPMSDLHEALLALGAEVHSLGEAGHLPVSVTRGTCRGGMVRIRGDVSSQFISALMLIAPLLPDGLHINIDGELVSRSYVEMTARVMQNFGAHIELAADRIVIQAGEYFATSFEIEPDYSSAAFPLLTVALRPGSVTIPQLALSEMQGDAEILEILNDMGIEVAITSPDITVSRSEGTALRPINRNMSNCSDLVPAVAVACACIPGTSRISGVGFIRKKESDRLGDLAHEMRKVGIRVEVEPDGLLIHGGIEPVGATFETHHDHRVAMALALLSLCTHSVVVKNPEVVTKSWPKYFVDMEPILGRPGAGK